ncbi:hypothetical protein PT974_04294 [Cladobotryum mycophilum]|uniref:Methyltransferase type 11 domain-containing protein n=1 Tax=Cladobotryum mycophilum TaxID=491253 RepID=A0ABR0SUN1_9HYPO
MWDVIWTDPDKELVGEHRAKKEKDGEQKKKKSSNHSGRASVSTTSSRSSIDSPFSLFRGRGLKRVNTASANGQMASSISSGLESPSIISARSPLSRTFDESSRHSSDRASASIFERHVDSPTTASPVPNRAAESIGSISRSPSNNDSVFSTSLGDVTASSSIDDGPMTESEKMRSLIQILEQSAPITEQEAINTSPQVNESEINDVPNVEKAATGEPLTPPMSPTNMTPRSPFSIKIDPPKSPTSLVPPLKSPLRLAAPKWYTPMMPNNPEAWKPPDEWEPAMSESRKSISEVLGIEPLPTSPRSRNSVVSLNFDSLQEDVLKMATINTSDLLSRLRQLWTKARNQNLQFLLGVSEEATEMRRWMLSVMNHLDPPDLNGNRVVPCKESPMTARMTMVLYESSITVKYLAALHLSKQLYHISTMPILYDQFCNVRSIAVPSISSNEFPVAPRLFESVHSLSLASLCPSTMLPGILTNVHKCLKIGGALHLTLIDPLPRAGTMGPRMRAWIERNLLQNLAKQSRCMSPSTLFPHLLGEVGLRGKGSILTTTKFYALPESTRSQDEDPDTEVEKLRAESEAKAEVRSLVGRMFWVEVWGAHVTADNWWWEEQACVQECLELGTFWEYHTIRGVKGE